MTISWADVEAIASELSEVSEAAQGAILDYVNDTAASDFAKRYLAAHYGQGTIDGSGAAAGAVQSESVGPISTTYAVTAAGGDALDSTPWGREFKRLTGYLRLPVALP